MSERWKVVIVGGGFGGLSAAQHLNSNLVDVTLIDRRNYHLFQPLLYQVATGSLSAGEVAPPLPRGLSRQKNTPVWVGTRVGIDPDSQRGLPAHGGIPPYHSFSVAAGAHTAHFAQHQAEKASGALAKIGVKVRCGAMVKDVDKEGLTINSGGQTDSIAAKTVVWAGGITPSPLGKILASHTKAETDKGRVKVKPD